VKVIGFQWNWQFEYPQYVDDQGRPLTIIGTCPSRCPELHIPVGREVAITLESADVIHSFWVPRLAGKLDAVPGRSNRMWLRADEPGVYAGQCAEFCGLGHALMRFTVVAQGEEEFQAWVNEQLGVGSAGQGPDLAQRGE
jgi:cytochrome c oxidase subunit 2